MTRVRLRGPSAQGNLAIAQDAYLSALTRLAPVEAPRRGLARLEARAIDALDAIDGDSDFEPDSDDRCEAAEDGCAPVLADGQVCWGSLADAESSRHAPRPGYTVDQTQLFGWLVI